MKFKKILVPCALAALMLTGCFGSKGGNNESGGDQTPDLSGTYNVSMWVSEVEGVTELTAQQIRDFEKENPGIVIKETLEGVSEADSATKVLADLDSAPDIYCFAQDQTARLIQGNALLSLGKKAAEEVTANNDAGSVQAVKSGDKLFAYPMTSDNGYFMYYDKSVIGQTDVTNFEELLAKCEAEGKYFAFEAETSAWYLASWFFGTGCISEWKTNEKGEVVDVSDTFNSVPNGLNAAKGIYKFVKSSAYLSSSGADAFTAATPAACLVSGTWVYNTVSETLGENMGVAELPYFHVGDKAYHLGSFSGNKLMGVKPQVDGNKAAVLQKLALYLTSEKCQMERFDKVAWGPSNKNAQKSEAVAANPALAALAKQNQYATPQGTIHGSWWDLAKVIATDIRGTDGSDAQLQAALDKYAAGLKDLFESHPWGIVGSMEESGWSTNIEMTEQADGTWVKTLDIAADVEFKVRKGSDWDTFNDIAVSFPEGAFEQSSMGQNVKCLTAGSYTLTLDPAQKTLVITNA